MPCSCLVVQQPASCVPLLLSGMLLQHTRLTVALLQSGYSPAYSTCEHATSYWKALTAPSNTTSNATRANGNVPCSGCPSS